MSIENKPRTGYIVNPLYDGLFFIFSPLLALVLGFGVAKSDSAQDQVTLFGGAYENSAANMFIGAFIMAHLVIVFVRSHGNKKIYQLHPIRFTVVPILLIAAMLSSNWILISVSVIATWWDVYHSSMQTFGLGRIYDMKRGNPPALGRRLDQMFNLLLYAGPILAGATLMDHVEDFSEFEEVGSLFFTAIPAAVESKSHYLTYVVLAIGVPFLAYYLYYYWRQQQRGYQVSMQKVLLYVSTGLCSIYTWGFNSFGEAFFIMNFFHALQYFALVWWSEKKNMIATMHLGGKAWAAPVMLVLYIALAFAYGLWAEVTTAENELVFSIILMVSIMHFWYDGFIWSVRKKQV